MDFAEKYRPTKLKDCILPKRIKSKLEKLVSKKNIGHLIFSGTAGIGKTATAMALIKEYEEWIDSVQNDQEVSYTVIKSKDNQGWTEEQEIDIQDPWG